MFCFKVSLWRGRVREGLPGPSQFFGLIKARNNMLRDTSFVLTRLQLQLT